MNVPAEIIPLQQICWNQLQDALQQEQALAAITSMIADLARGLWVPIFAAVLFCAVAVVVYHPRIQRGGFWMPAFGLFGGTPKLYLHTRPASFAGLFVKSRHRVALRRRSKL